MSYNSVAKEFYFESMILTDKCFVFGADMCQVQNNIEVASTKIDKKNNAWI